MILEMYLCNKGFIEDPYGIASRCGIFRRNSLILAISSGDILLCLPNLSSIVFLIRGGTFLE